MAKTKIVDGSLRTPRGINKEGLITKTWQNFLKKIQDHKENCPEEWTKYSVVGYFLSKLKKPYIWSFAGAPSSCKEIYCVNRTKSVLGCSYYEMKEYVDFVYDSISDINSFAILFNDNMLRKYNDYKDKQNIRDRSTPLPKSYLRIISESKLDIYTWGDLSFVMQAIHAAPERYSEYIQLIDKLRPVGFDEAFLEVLDE